MSHGLEAHISVQENVTNSYALKTLKKLGAKRAILSRELSLREVTEITRKSPIETEIFMESLKQEAEMEEFENEAFLESLRLQAELEDIAADAMMYL